MTITYEWRGEVGEAELEALHAAAFGRPPGESGWTGRLRRHSLGWVCARDDGTLVGFVNVAWDGGTHAFLLDTAVAPDRQGEGIGAAVVRRAPTRPGARGADGSTSTSRSRCGRSTSTPAASGRPRRDCST